MQGIGGVGLMMVFANLEAFTRPKRRNARLNRALISFSDKEQSGSSVRQPERLDATPTTTRTVKNNTRREPTQFRRVDQ